MRYFSSPLRTVRNLITCILLLLLVSVVLWNDRYYNKQHEDESFDHKVSKMNTRMNNPEDVTKIIIVAYGRGGSDFLRDILKSHPDSFCVNEPLFTLARKDKFLLSVKDGRTPEESSDLLYDLLDCNFQKLSKYMQWIKEMQLFPSIQLNEEFWHICKRGTNNDLCFDADYLSAYCRNKTLRIIKAVRLPMNNARELLSKIPDLKVIHSVRDPRAVMRSRHAYPVPIWCRLEQICWNTKIFCRFVEDNLESACLIQKLYPERFVFIRYEDLACKPYPLTNNLFKFLNRTLHNNTIKYLDSHTNSSSTKKSSILAFGAKSPAYDTYRVSKVVPFKWQEDRESELLIETENSCQTVIRKLNLPFVKDLQPGELNCESWSLNFTEKERFLCPLTIQFIGEN